MAVEYIADGCTGNLETQLEELALQFAIPPAGILLGQTHNQVFNFGIESGSTAFLLTLIGPLAAYQFPMPLQHRFRLKNPYDLPELLGRSVGMPFEFVDQNSQNQFFWAVGLDKFLCFLATMLS